MTDYKQLCAELVDDLELCDWPYKLKEAIRADIERARTALAKPEPEGPTDEEILNLSEEHDVSYTTPGGVVIYPYQDSVDIKGDVLSFARALIAADRARCGHLAQSEPEGPTVMEIIELADEIEAEELGQVDLVRRALARWGK